MMDAEIACGSASARTNTTPNTTKTSAASDTPDATADKTVTGVKDFHLLLSSAAPQSASAKTTVPSDAPAGSDKTSDATDPAGTPSLNLLMSLLPALPPTTVALATAPVADAGTVALTAIATAASVQTASAVSAAAELTTSTNAVATDATTPIVAIASNASVAAQNLATIPAMAASVSAIATTADSSLSAMLATVAAPLTKKNEDSGLSLSAVTTSNTLDHALISLDRSFQLAPASVTAAATATPAPDALSDLSMTHKDWPMELGHRLLWNLSEGIQKAEIRVSPQGMGPIHVHIQVQDNKTDLQFTAAHPLTREALESSIPRLREMFSQQGLNLSQAQVFSQTPRDSNGRQPAPSSAVFKTRTDEAVVPDGSPASTSRISMRLLDDYA